MKVLTLTHAQVQKLHRQVQKLKRQPGDRVYLIQSKHWRSFMEELTNDTCHILLKQHELDVLFSRLHNYLTFKKANFLALEYQVKPGKYRVRKIGTLTSIDVVMEPGMKFQS